MGAITTIVQEQHTFFKQGHTLDYTFRMNQLEKLKTMLQDHEELIYKALAEDLNKSEQEAHMTELGFLYLEIDLAIKHLKDWMTPEKVRTPLTHKGTSSYIHKEPYGVTLIIAPWNYPLQLALGPAIGAIAAGNCVVIKPSEFSQATSSVIAKIIRSTFDPSYIAVVEGAVEASQKLLAERFDYIFFTGSPRIGKVVMRAASEHLTPVTLELGGKSPAIVDQDADVKLAAKRIVWGKFTNAGQTCVAPDYLYVHEKVQKKLIKELKKYISSFYGKNPLENPDYVRIINMEQFNRLNAFLADGTILAGGNVDFNQPRIEPTLLGDITWDDAVMQEEIFGPILPILIFSDLNVVLEEIKDREKPLALYYFSNDKKKQDKIINEVSFGGGCMNDTLFHLANPHLPFGGVGNSGMGSYHGVFTFDTFSHKKSIMHQTNRFDIPLRYPGSKIASAIIKKVMN